MPLSSRNGTVCCIKDPTLGGDLWVSRQALRGEASGYVLVPEGRLARGYQPVTLAEAERVYGRGYTSEFRRERHPAR